MSRVLAHPFGFGADGAARTVEQWTPAEAAQLVQVVASTIAGERPLAPHFGMTDTAGRTVAPAELIAAVELAEPDLVVVDVTTTGPAQGTQHMRATAEWRDDQ